jgi:2-dehydro-3-deoxyphosphooctonate aldolase (KDO 8-P synthase)
VSDDLDGNLVDGGHAEGAGVTARPGCPVAPVRLAPGVEVGQGRPLVLIAGPCIIESTEQVLRVAWLLRELSRELGIPVVFKASFDKANRSSIRSFRGPGLLDGLAALAEVKRQTGLPVLTDVHEPHQAEAAAAVVDVLQVPAFLCRQTDLVLACGRTGKPVNVKKGQFVAPADMVQVVDKIRSTGNHAVTLTERGSSFGYNNLVVDMRAFQVMRSFAPVVFDVTHSLQLPGGGESTGGAREFALPLARAAVAAGVDALFAEVHEDPPHALSDATTQLAPDELRTLVRQALAIRQGYDEAVS